MNLPFRAAAARESILRVSDRKRLLQHYRHFPEVPPASSEGRFWLQSGLRQAATGRVYPEKNLARSDYAAWLGERTVEPRELLAMLKPYPAEERKAIPIGRRVGNVKYDEPSLIEPVAVQVG